MINEKYNKEKIYNECIEKIELYYPSNMTELIGLLSCSKATFYKKIKYDSIEYQQIEEKIEKGRSKIVNKAKKKLLLSDNPTALISVIKLYGTDADRQALNQNVNVNANATLNYEDVKKIELNINKLSVEEQKQLNALLKKLKDG